MLRRFEGKAHADDYAKYRPTWPPVVFEKLVSYLKEDGGTLQQAVDIGCGTGISTKLLSAIFENVVGIDVSEAMLSQAPKDIPNVTFRQGPGEDLSFLPPESVDAITCAASIHWLDLKKFYKEADHVLKPGGVLASFTYCTEHLLGNADAELFLSKFYSETLEKYYDKAALDTIYFFGEFEQPYKDFVRFLDLSLEKTWPLSEFLGYLSTVSATRKLIESGSQEFDEFANELLEIYKRDIPDQLLDRDTISYEDVIVTTIWDIQLNLSRKPQS